MAFVYYITLHLKICFIFKLLDFGKSRHIFNHFWALLKLYIYFTSGDSNSTCQSQEPITGTKMTKDLTIQRRVRRYRSNYIRSRIRCVLRLLHTLCSEGPPQLFSGGGFSTSGGPFRSNFYPKNYNFSDDFLVIFWYYIFIWCCFIVWH